MKSKNFNLGLIILAFVVIALIIYWLYGQNNSQLNNKINNQPSNNQNTELQFKPDGSLIYAERSKEKSDLYSHIFKTNETKKIYTDSDEKQKIASFGNVIDNGKILAFMKESNDIYIGTLYLLLNDGSGKKESLISDFASTQSPIISPDGKKIAYTLFSNAEADFGFRLIVANSQGTSKQELDKDATNITIYSWNPESSQICFTKGANDQESSLYLVDIKSNQIDELTKIKGQLNSLNWGANDTFVASNNEKNKSLNDTELYKFSRQKTKLEKLTKNQKYDDFPIISPDGNNIMFFSADYAEDKISIYKEGEIYIIDINGQNLTKIGSGNYPLGWIK